MSNTEINIYNNLTPEQVQPTQFVQTTKTETNNNSLKGTGLFVLFLSIILLTQLGVIQINPNFLKFISVKVSELGDIPKEQNSLFQANNTSPSQTSDAQNKETSKAPVSQKPSAPTNKKEIKIPVYNVHTGYYLDKTPPGSYDFTIELNGKTSGTPIPAPCNGVIVKKWFQGRNGGLKTGKGAGQIIAFYCEDSVFKGHVVLFGHLITGSGLEPGTSFIKGQTIGHQGTTGRSSGNHIHGQVHYAGKNKSLGTRISDRKKTRPMMDWYLRYLRGQER